MALLFFRGAVTKPLCSPQERHHNWGKDRDFLEGPVGKAGQNRRASGSFLLSCPTVSSQQSRSAECHRGEMKDTPGGLRTPEMTPLSSFGGQLFEGECHQSASNGTFNLSSGIRPVHWSLRDKGHQERSAVHAGPSEEAELSHTCHQESLPGVPTEQRRCYQWGRRPVSALVCGFQPSRQLLRPDRRKQKMREWDYALRAQRSRTGLSLQTNSEAHIRTPPVGNTLLSDSKYHRPALKWQNYHKPQSLCNLNNFSCIIYIYLSQITLNFIKTVQDNDAKKKKKNEERDLCSNQQVLFAKRGVGR